MLPQEKPETGTSGYQCEVCGKYTDALHTHSIAVVYRKPGAYMHPTLYKEIGIAGYQCENQQHFACCHAHAAELAVACMMNHLDLYGEPGDIAAFKESTIERIQQKHTDAADSYSHRARHESMLGDIKRREQLESVLKNMLQERKQP